jgi:formylmethanofuran dehydrogenase subunit E
VYTFFNRATGKAIRISEDFRGFEGDARYGDLRKRQEAGEDVSREMQQFKREKAAAILTAEEKDIFTISAIAMPAPDSAKIRKSLRCAVCGEKFMESRGRARDGSIVCIPCSEKGPA